MRRKTSFSFHAQPTRKEGDLSRLGNDKGMAEHRPVRAERTGASESTGPGRKGILDQQPLSPRFAAGRGEYGFYKASGAGLSRFGPDFHPKRLISAPYAWYIGVFAEKNDLCGSCFGSLSNKNPLPGKPDSSFTNKNRPPGNPGGSFSKRN